MINTTKLRVGLLLTALGAISVLPAMCVMPGCSTKISDSVVTRITTTEATRRHTSKKALFIDARPKAAYQRGHIANAISLRLGDVSFTERDPRLTSHSPLIIYGENPGSASALALAKRLLELEYKEVIFYEPGLAGWRSAGLQIDRPSD